MVNEFESEYIKPDDVADNPGTLEYAHHRGSAVVKPEDKGKIAGRAVNAMEHQTDIQLAQIKQQMELLAGQVKSIMTRKEISFRIYQSEMRFEPLINHVYYLYSKSVDGSMTFQLSMFHRNNGEEVE
jgi:hypothetical protein